MLKNLKMPANPAEKKDPMFSMESPEALESEAEAENEPVEKEESAEKSPMASADDEELIAELEKRGYTCSKA